MSLYSIVICEEKLLNCLSGVMFRMVASNAKGCGFYPWPSQTKDIKIGVCCFFTKQAALRSNSKDRSGQGQNNVSG